MDFTLIQFCNNIHLYSNLSNGSHPSPRSQTHEKSFVVHQKAKVFRLIL